MELKATGITRQYQRQGRGTNIFTAVKETDLVLETGKLVEIEGRSGSGKSTLLNMMAGILAPTAGRVELDGQNLYDLPDPELSRIRNRQIGMIPQGQTGLRALTVLENVLLPAMLYPESAGQKEQGARKEELKARAQELLEQVGIAHLQGAYPDELSGGELRRLAIARALIMDPGIVLADEPTADLDDENTRAVLSLLRGCADEGRAVLLVTHEREAAEYADEVYRMNDGRLSAEALRHV
ncbi:MAG: ABC transporter ATP-binding protein [Eubacteriales bacterium]|nr:ABC transporter ATP-binding protein [Eubacteriales bacterium]